MDYNYDYVYTTSQPGATETAAGAVIIGTIFFFVFIFALISYAVTAWLLGRIFKKAGQPQWPAC